MLEVVPGDGVLVGHQFFGGTHGHHLAAQFAGAGPQVQHLCRAAYGVLVVLHHDQGVALLLQFFQCI